MRRSLKQIGADRLHELGIKGRGILVGVCDTGISHHPDLDGRIIAAKDFTDSPHGTEDVAGHGTGVSGIIAANGRLVGVAPESGIVMAKVLGDEGYGNYQAIIEGMKWLVGRGAKVINLSLGSDGPSDGLDPIAEAVNWACEQGVACVAASGNANGGEGSMMLGSPASAEGAIAVAAVDRSNRPAHFTSRGPTADGRKHPHVAAPGVGIEVPNNGGGYSRMSGTSFSAPHVAGLCALLLQARPDLKPIELREILVAGARVA